VASGKRRGIIRGADFVRNDGVFFVGVRRHWGRVTQRARREERGGRGGGARFFVSEADRAKSDSLLCGLCSELRVSVGEGVADLKATTFDPRATLRGLRVGSLGEKQVPRCARDDNLFGFVRNRERWHESQRYEEDPRPTLRGLRAGREGKPKSTAYP
jgi:hypothetical protein